jgi:AcrR family transcriptional regulator
VSSGRDRQRAETKQRLFDAALEIFRRDGVQNARIEDITALAGTSRAAFYFHFPAREDVLLSVLHASEARVGREVAALPADLPIIDVLGQVAELIAAEWEHEPSLFSEVGAAALRRASQNVDESPTRSALGERFERAIAEGEVIDAVPAQMLADLFLLNQFAITLSWSADPRMPLAPMLNGAALLFMTGAQKARRSR